MAGCKLEDLFESCIDLRFGILPDRKWVHVRVCVSKIERAYLNRNAVVISSKRIDDFARLHDFILLQGNPDSPVGKLPKPFLPEILHSPGGKHSLETESLRVPFAEAMRQS